MSREARRQRQKDFVKVFNRLTGRYAPWQIWQDMVLMYACAISNSVPHLYRAQREELYMNTVKKYEEAEIKLFVELIGQLILTMEISVGYEKNYGDFLGELFMELNLGNNLGGQFFTPYDVCVMMAQCAWNDDLLRERDRQGYISVNDCACGAGATLIAFAQVCREKGINYQQDVLFVAQDIDSTTALMCYIQLSLLGCAGYIHIGNTLTNPMTGHVLFGDNASSTWYTPMYYSDTWVLRQIRARNRMVIENQSSGVATAHMEAAEASPIASIPEAGGSDSHPQEAQAAPTLEEPVQPAYIVSVSKKNEGQIMFDFGS